MDTRAAVEAIRATLPGTIAIYLFGSRARGDAGRHSDVDVAVIAPGGMPDLVRFELQERLAALLHADVDLVDLTRASSVLRVQVLEHGSVLYDGDPAARALFEATALASYARLNEERAGILDDVRRTGRVHG
jgi:predicted nucleotidyltransferase